MSAGRWRLLLAAGVVVLAVLGVLLLVRPDRPLGPVAVEAPPATGDAASVCAQVLEAVPDVLDGLPRRPVQASGPAAAWGEPAVTLACGVEPPLRAEPPVGIGPPDGEPVLFTTRDIGAGTRFTTSETAVRVAVEIPDAYDVVPLQRLLPALALLPEAPAG